MRNLLHITREIYLLKSLGFTKFSDKSHRSREIAPHWKCTLPASPPRQYETRLQEANQSASLILRLAHGDKFFRTGRMNGDSIIEIGFGRAHFNGHRKTLDHFVHAITYTVQSDDFFIFTHAH